MSASPNVERNAEIMRRRLAGELPSDIWRAMGISRNIVLGVLHRAGIVRHDNSAGLKKYANPPRGENQWNSKLTTEAVALIRADYRPGKPYHPGNAQALATRYGVRVRTIYRLVGGFSWRHVR
jgi:hypothetical protein